MYLSKSLIQINLFSCKSIGQQFKERSHRDQQCPPAAASPLTVPSSPRGALASPRAPGTPRTPRAGTPQAQEERPHPRQPPEKLQLEQVAGHETPRNHLAGAGRRQAVQRHGSTRDRQNVLRVSEKRCSGEAFC